MSTKSDQLKKILEQMVRAEVNRVVPMLVKEEMLKVMGGMLMEGRRPEREAHIDDERPFTGNSNKRRELMQSAQDHDETEPQFDRASLAEQMGYGEYASGASRRSGRKVMLDSRITENGNVIPINPSEVPDSVMEAINRDYSGLIKAWEEKKRV
jgi:hypothetical protein